MRSNGCAMSSCFLSGIGCYSGASEAIIIITMAAMGDRLSPTVRLSARSSDGRLIDS